MTCSRPSKANDYSNTRARYSPAHEDFNAEVMMRILSDALAKVMNLIDLCMENQISFPIKPSKLKHRYENQLQGIQVMLRLRYLHLFAYWFPREFHFKSSKAMFLYDSFCTWVCELYDELNGDLYEESIETINYLMALSELIVLEAEMHNLCWYTYLDCPNCRETRQSYQEIYHPPIISLAWFYETEPEIIAARLDLASVCACPPLHDFYFC